MKVYIPSYLRKLSIIDQLYRLIENYSNYFENPTDSFDDYLYSLKNDPVKKFLNQCMFEVNEKNNKEYTIDYISRLFYSVKGSIKIFEYMRKYLNLKFEGDIIYTTHYIEIHLSKNRVTDESTFYKNLKEFLDSLIYYQELRLIVDNTELVIGDNIDNYIGYNITNYNNFTAEEYEIDS